jgi:beta-glucosidase
MKFQVLALLLIVANILSIPAQERYKNPALSADERAGDLLSRMTLEEKINQMRNNANGIERLEIRSYDWWNEALHGVARAGKATVFPQTIGLAATFDDKAVRETYDMISDEARAKYHDFQKKKLYNGYKGLTFWTPNINIFRDPRWGRGMETYGEDPYLTSRMGVAVVKGLQGDGSQKYDKAHACAKHYAVHSGPEWNRHSFDANNISERDLRETYLPAFKALVVEGNVKEVMCAYNRFEGKPCCSSKELLGRILRYEWGFDNIIVSDCGAIADFYNTGKHETHVSAVDASADAVLTGTDLECGGSFHSLGEAVKQGLISESRIDESVFRLLRARFQLGMFDDDSLVSWASIPYSVVECDEHKAKALEMARKSIVLLNNKNNILPLKKEGKIAVMGPNANDSVMLWANYNGLPTQSVTILDGIKSKLPAGSVIYEKGCDYVDDRIFFSYFDQCAYEGKRGFKATFWNNRDFSGDIAATGQVSTPLNYDTGGGTVFMPGVNLSNFTARFESVFTPLKTEEVAIMIAADDGSRVFVDGKEFISDWTDGPAQKREYTMNVEQGRSYHILIEYYQAGGKGELKFDIGLSRKVDYKAVAQKVKDVDAIIFVGGISSSFEGEEMGVNLPGFRNGDRTNIDLPQVQKDMLQALKNTGKPVIFVLCSGSTMALSWENENLDAILAAWYPGQEGGTAVADVIFGDYNPAGRLPLTFYASSNDLPDFEDYNMKNGRTYRYFEGTPLFPFGHGLSYTNFVYSQAKLGKKKMTVHESTTLNLTIENTGMMDGDEVIQVYIRNLQDPKGPLKSLRGFKRIFAKAGQTVPITINLPASSFEFFNPKTEIMEIISGNYEILYGGTSDDKQLKSLSLELVNPNT